MLGGEATMEQGNVILSRYPIENIEKEAFIGEYNPTDDFSNKNGADRRIRLLCAEGEARKWLNGANLSWVLATKSDW